MAEPPIILPFEDWAGITDQKERRKRQNRLNQRTRRQRKLALQSESKSSTSSKTQQKEIVSVRLADLQILNTLCILGPGADASIRLITNLEAEVLAEYATGTPRADLLLGLVQLNILRSFIVNIEVLGLNATEMHDDAQSPFLTGVSWRAARTNTPLPAAMMPTPLQCSVPHHPWLDLLPIPQMRDNIIPIADALDETDLCHEIMNFQSGRDGPSGVIVWKDPWDPTGWEISATFLRRWGWLLRDCWDLFRSTNYWRARRGETRLSRTAWALACKEIQP